MKQKVGLDMLPADTQEMQLICNCCGKPYYPDKVHEDLVRAIVFGTEKYAMCPLCTQAVPDEVFRDTGYRQRCHYEIARLQRLLETEGKTPTREENRVAEPTYEELKTRVAELEKLGRRASLQFKVRERVASVSTALAAFP